MKEKQLLVLTLPKMGAGPITTGTQCSQEPTDHSCNTYIEIWVE